MTANLPDVVDLPQNFIKHSGLLFEALTCSSYIQGKLSASQKKKTTITLIEKKKGQCSMLESDSCF